jgi:hypothetical protein
MTTANTVITKANIVAQFKTIRDTYNSGIVWHSTNNPFTPSASNNYGSAQLIGGTSAGYATGTIEDNILDSEVVASTIVTQFKSYATSLSRIRSARLIKYYNTNGSNSATYDQTQITNLNSSYQSLMDPVLFTNVTKDSLLTASDLDAFVARLSTAINTNRTTTLTFIEYYCHSSCHNSCHGSI